MNELLQTHGCSNVFTVPEGLKELMSDITREVLREQPKNIFTFISNYLSVLIITREHGIMAVKILDDLCDCKPTVSEHLIQVGMERDQADFMASIIKEEIEDSEPVKGKEGVKEIQIIKKILDRQVLDEDMATKVCQISRNAFRDYWYKKKLLEKSLKENPEEPWEIAAANTLEIYKKTKPSFSELSRATQVIQAAYRGYHVRCKMLGSLKPKKKQGPKVDLHGPPLDIAHARELNLGPIIDIKVKEDDVTEMFANKHVGEKVGLKYDPTKTITHIDIDKMDDVEDDIATELPDISRSAEGTQQVTPATSMQKISFKGVELIADDEANYAELMTGEASGTTDMSEGEMYETNTYVIEEIQGERIDGEVDSASNMSVPSSAPDTANTTDVEEVPEEADEVEQENEN